MTYNKIAEYHADREYLARLDDINRKIRASRAAHGGTVVLRKMRRDLTHRKMREELKC